MPETRDAAVSFTLVNGGSVHKTRVGDRYEQLFEQAPFGIITVDRDRRAVACNDAACRLLAVPRHELLGMALMHWVPPQDQRAFENMLLGAFQGTLEGGRSAVERRDGTVRRVSIRVVPLGEPSEVVAVNVFVTEAVDETDPRTDAGISLVEGAANPRVEPAGMSGRAERFGSIGELVVSVVRELHAPLVSLHMAAQRLLAQASGDTRRTLEQVVGEAARSRTLVESLLAFTSDQQRQHVSTDLGSLIGEVVGEQRSVLQASSIAVDVRIAPDLPAVFIDPGHVRQLLRNLVANARDAVAHRTRGKIRVEAARNAEGILIRVCDNGPGMHSADPEKIFDPFFTTKPGRLGLGLSIARAITTAYGGRLRAERSPQRWTEFSIELPIEPLTSATAFQAIPLTLTHGRSVLVIDDDEAIRGVMRRILTRAGYRVSEAWSGRSALSQIASGDLPDFVITDLRMSDGTGPWFLNRLGEDFPQLLPRTVIVTGEGSTEEVERTARETGCRVVRKPFEFHQLIAALDEVASRG